MKKIAAIALSLISVAGLTLAIVSTIELNREVSGLRWQLEQAENGMEDVQNQVGDMQPTVQYLSQFNGWYEQNSYDSSGYVDGHWYMPAKSGPTRPVPEQG